MDDRKFRAEHVGSLLRPERLVGLRMAMLKGQGDPEALQSAEDDAVRAVLTRQEDVGLDVVNDGEFRRFSFMGEVTGAVSGFAPGELPNPDWHNEEGVANPGSFAMLATAPLKPHRRIAHHEASFLSGHTQKPFKITLPSPLVVAQAGWMPKASGKAYPKRADLMWAVADLLKEEVRLLAEEGVPYIQIDNPGLAIYIDPDLRERSKAAGVDVDIPLEEALAADGHLVKDLPDHGPIVAMHLCRGNWRSAWLAQGSLEPVARSLFAQPRFDRFLLEYDSDRAGGFQPLRHLPEGRTAVLGLVTTKRGDLESEDALVRRIEEASAFAPLDQLALSPQCGFASSIPGNLVSEDEQWAKLELVVNAARRVWGE